MGKILRITMADVGVAAGVSQAAVSLALRNHASIPPATRERIRAAARKIGYHPHAGISSLMAQIRSKRRVKFGARLAGVTNWSGPGESWQFPAWRVQWESARRRATELGWGLEEFSIGQRGLSVPRLASILQARGIEGVIVFPLSTHSILPLPWEKFASVAIGYTLESPLLHRVVTAHFDSVPIALEQLRLRGYRRIGIALDGRLSVRVHRCWLAAFCAFGFEAAGIDPSAIAVLPAIGTKSALRKWVKSFRPEAVLYGGPYPIRRWMEESGLSAPDEIGIAGLADFRPDEGCAHIDEGWHHIGSAAVDNVVGQLSRGERGVPSHAVLSLIRGEWIDGDSVRPAPAAHSVAVK
ncbi:MAG: LacI family DNA-binding transcriptional regulator [Opitutaceae bacterium]|nr:LacI family DNA-binding transcriptional regulator [Opitutaceae bacterium]